ncbi:MAG: hypothetical protein COT73_02910 [Bdellovibrio sp. CG10_big_fil_rev_8_21_14_0_10_47_8]|nr:MAG: hypothetical protein COT73_02910 [Bdellovibrio sp. CG10_big_fil_rev_8_21_14_0_10_47_8]
MGNVALSAPAQSKEIIFSKKQIKLGSQVLTVEIADTDQKSAQGLMFRKSLKDGAGMLFIFSDEGTRSFWMKNTFIPLSIGYFNEKKELMDIQDMAPATSEMQVDFPTYVSKSPAKYALEVPKGWFKKHKIQIKEKFSFL